MEELRPKSSVEILSTPLSGSDPNKFSEIIKNLKGNQVGEWHAYICHSESDIMKYRNFDESHIKTIYDFTDQSWPIAYLSNIEIDRGMRNRGNGTRGILAFLEKAASKGCIFALAQIGWDEDSPMEKNFHFYRKNGWKLLFDVDSDGINQGTPLTMVKTPIISPSSAETPHPPE